MATRAWHGVVSDDGKKCEFELPSEFHAHLKRMAGKPFTLSIVRRRNKVSGKQMAYIHGVAIPIIAEEAGYDYDEREDLYYQLLVKCFGTRRHETLGCDVPNVTHLSDKDTQQGSEFIQWLPRFASKTWGCIVPEPNDAE
jgi:hypothetical protein